MSASSFSVMVDGKPVEYVVKRPDARVRSQATLVKAKAFRDAASGGAVFRDKLQDWMVEQGIFDQKKRDEIAEIRKRIGENERKIPNANGKVAQAGVTAEDAKEAAIKVLIDRSLLQTLLAPQFIHDSLTAEGIAEDAEFDYLVSVCTKDEGGNPAFKNLDDYQARNDKGDEVAAKAASAFASIWRGLDPDFEKNLPERKYLEQIKFWEEAKSAVSEADTFDLVAEPTAVPAPAEAVEPTPVPAPYLDVSAETPESVVA